MRITLLILTLFLIPLGGCPYRLLYRDGERDISVLYPTGETVYTSARGILASALKRSLMRRGFRVFSQEDKKIMQLQTEIRELTLTGQVCDIQLLFTLFDNSGTIRLKKESEYHALFYTAAQTVTEYTKNCDDEITRGANRLADSICRAIETVHAKHYR